MKRVLIYPIVVLAAGLWSLHSTAIAQQSLVAKPLAEKKVEELPAEPLFWRIENFAALPQAQAAAGPWSLVAESAGKVWLFTLGPAGGRQRAALRLRKLDQSPASPHRNTSFGSWMLVVLRAASRPCTPIPARRLSSCWRESKASAVPTGRCV
jgi:hypothetical protein